MDIKTLNIFSNTSQLLLLIIIAFLFLRYIKNNKGIRIDILLSFLAAFLTLVGLFSSSKMSYLNFSQGESHRLMTIISNYEYNEWKASVLCLDNDISLSLRGRKNNGSHLQMFDVEVTALYKDNETGIVEESVNRSSPKMIFTKNNVNDYQIDDQLFIINIKNLNSLLKKKYDGTKATSIARFELAAFEIKLKYWSTIHADTPFIHEALIQKNDWVYNDHEYKNLLINTFKKEEWK
ncbi:MAG: hypothetical protein JXA99_01335 [Candidatus Lokiarchaeota archaeon]|nr:hypothetical protein [Candidatus Lokiarchaeota archaeon]